MTSFINWTFYMLRFINATGHPYRVFSHLSCITCSPTWRNYHHMLTKGTTKPLWHADPTHLYQFDIPLCPCVSNWQFNSKPNLQYDLFFRSISHTTSSKLISKWRMLIAIWLPTFSWLYHIYSYALQWFWRFSCNTCETYKKWLNGQVKI